MLTINKAILIGRLTRDPDIKYTNNSAVARFCLAVDRQFKREGDPTADFINCVSFGKAAEFAEKYLTKGTKLCVTGRIQTGSYTNKDGQKVYTTDVIVESQEFVESKASASQHQEDAPAEPKPKAKSNAKQTAPAEDDFMTIEDGVETELPFA